MILKFKKEVIIFMLSGALTLAVCLSVIKNPSVLALNDESGHFSIIMYHHITENKSKIGDYTVSAEQLKADFEYLKNNGYTTLSVRDLLAIDNGETKLKEKSVMITFDDGQESFYKYAYPLLLEYNFKAVFSIIGIKTEEFSKAEDHNVAYSHVTYEQIAEMVSSGLVEIGNHSYNMHKNSKEGRNGVTIKTGESFEEYEKALNEDINKFNTLFNENLNYTPQIFTYPFGRYTDETEAVIKKAGFMVAFTCYEKKMVPKANDNWLYRLGRYNRSGKYSTESFFKKAIF